jgi:hypothetical protein
MSKSPKVIGNHQHCSLCSAYVIISSRYPSYACRRCVNHATDKAGSKVEFCNITFSGHGVQGKFVDTGKLYRSTICYIKGVKFRVEEAHLGGIVVIPEPKNTRKRKVNTDKIIPTTISKSDKSDSITFG